MGPMVSYGNYHCNITTVKGSSKDRQLPEKNKSPEVTPKKS